MEKSTHSRSGSSDTTKSANSYQQTYQHMLEHVFAFPNSCEIPLRTMYAINSAVRTQPGQASRGGTPSPGASPIAHSPTSAAQESQDVTARFTSTLMAQLCSLPNQPNSLPPSFVNTFVRRCFNIDLEKADFTQGLTALDYLRDLENRRRKDVAATLQRLGVERNTIGTPADTISERFPTVAAFVKTLETRDRKADASYTQLWIALRRWILISEFSAVPYNKNNCVALLNTLYPPVMGTQPSSKLTPTILAQQREGFFKYIAAVAQHGPRVLGKLKEQNKRPGDDSGWPNVYGILDLYLQSALRIINDCEEAIYDENLDMSDKTAKRNGRKVDSGVSFGSSDRRTSSSSTATSSLSKQVPPTPPTDYRTNSKRPFAFHKLAKKFLSSRSKPEQVQMPAQLSSNEKASLRKMRSIGTLADVKQKNMSAISVTSGTRDDMPVYDKEEMQRQRLLFEARHSRRLD